MSSLFVSRPLKVSRSLLSAAVIAIAFTLPNAVLAQASDQPNKNDKKPAIIRVTGIGEVSVEPDMALYTIGVVEQAETAKQALTANNEKMEQLTSAMKAAGIEDKDLQTSSFSIAPQYEHSYNKGSEPPKPPKVIGYQVSNQLTIRIRELSKLGEILDKAVTLGANQGGNLQFSNSEPEKILEQARTRAMKNAIARAETLAGAAGVKLGSIDSISEQSASPRPVRMMRAEMAMASDKVGRVPVQAGESSYSVRVDVSWELDQ